MDPDQAWSLLFHPHDKIKTSESILSGAFCSIRYASNAFGSLLGVCKPFLFGAKCSSTIRVTPKSWGGEPRGRGKPPSHTH